MNQELKLTACLEILIEDQYLSKKGRAALHEDDFSPFISGLLRYFNAIKRDGMQGPEKAPKQTAKDLERLKKYIRTISRDLPTRVSLDLDLGGLLDRISAAQERPRARTNADQELVAVVDFGLRLGREFGTKSWMWKRPPPKSLPTDAEIYFSILAEALGVLPTENNGAKDFRRAWLNYLNWKTEH